MSQEKLYAWAESLVSSSFTHYVKAKEGAWINPQMQMPDDLLWDDTKLRDAGMNKYSTTGWESDFLRQTLQKFFNENDLYDLPLLDIGCGDGRVSGLCAELGVKKIIGVDIFEKNVKNAARKKSSTSSEVLYIQGDANDLPFKENSLPLVLCSGLPFMPGFLDKLYPLLKKGAFVFYMQETSLEAALLYALVRSDIDEFYTILETKTRATVFEKKDEDRYAIGQIQNLLTAVQAAGFELREHLGVSVFASLIFGGIFQSGSTRVEEKEKAYQMLQNPSISQNPPYRQHWLVLQK